MGRNGIKGTDAFESVKIFIKNYKYFKIIYTIFANRIFILILYLVSKWEYSFLFETKRKGKESNKTTD